MADPGAAAAGCGNQRPVWTQGFTRGRVGGGAAGKRRGLRHGIACGRRVLFSGFAASGISGALDARWRIQRGFCLLPGPAFPGHAAGGDGRGISDPRLQHWLYVGGPKFLPVLHLSEPVPVLHADPGTGWQLSPDVCGMGRRGSGFLSADRVLVYERLGRLGGQEGVHRQPYRRLRLSDWAVPDHPAFRFAELYTCVRGCRAIGAGNRRRGISDGNCIVADGWSGGKVGADSLVCLAAGRDGRPNAGFSAHPRRHHGDGGRLHGGALACDL